MKSCIRNKILFASFILLIFLLFSCKTVAEIKEGVDRDKFLEYVDKEVEVGRAVFAKLAGHYGIVKDKETTAYLNKLGKSIGLFTERQELEYYFAILNTEKINGYALPGGFILITLGALKNIDEPGELVGILAHELGHVNLRHILKHVKIEVKMNFFEILARFLAGPRQVVTSMVGEISGKIEEALFINGLSSVDEYEADAYSINLMKSFNINQSSYTNYLVRLSHNKDLKALEILDKTHPPLNDRINAAKSIMNDSLPIMKPTEAFTKFKNKIASIKVEDYKPKEEE